MPANQFDRQAAAYHHARRLRIAPNVVLCGGCDVAFATGGPTHDYAATYFFRDARTPLESEGNVRQRSQGYQNQPGIGLDGLDHRFHRRLLFDDAPWRRITVITETVLAVKPVRALVRAPERFCGANKHGNIRTAKLRGIQRVPGGLLDANISGDCRYCEH